MQESGRPLTTHQRVVELLKDGADEKIAKAAIEESGTEEERQFCKTSLTIQVLRLILRGVFRK